MKLFTGRDVSGQNFEGQDLTGSVFQDCEATGASFKGCLLKKVEIRCNPGRKVSWRGVSFESARLRDVVFGPRTLDLSDACFKGAKLNSVEFRLGKLARADFEQAQLKEVLFRQSWLDQVRFCGARIHKVSFEGARLVGADFTGAEFFHQDLWGEPDYTGAIIPDELRYQFGEVKQALPGILRLIETQKLGPEITQGLLGMVENHQDFLSHSELLLIDREFSAFLNRQQFVQVIKALKQGS